MLNILKGLLMVAFAGGIGLTLAAVDKEVLPTLDGSDAGDTTLTNKPPDKVEGEKPGIPPRNPRPGERPPGAGDAEPRETGEPPEALPELEKPEAGEPEQEPGSLPPAPKPPEQEPGTLPPPEQEPAAEPKPGGGAIKGETEEPYVPTEQLGADAAVDFPVDI